MKKTLLFLSTAFIAMSMSAQIVKTSQELCNFVDIQAEAATLTATTPTSTVFSASANGTKFWGYLQSSGTETAVSWNSKTDYNTTIPMPELEGTLDSLTVGTMFRAGSGAHIDLGAFTTTAAGKVSVYFQPNGDSNRGLSITHGSSTVSKIESGAKLGDMRPGYIAELEIPAGTYAAGDVIITVLTNTSNIFGIRIENLQGGGTGISNNEINNHINFDGTQIVNNEGLSLSVYNTIGKLVATSNSSINMSNFDRGIYIIRAEGIKGALKICK